MHCFPRRLPAPQRRRRRAFSLVELVIVVVIIGIIAAIAVPRISQGSRSAQANSIRATLTNVRAAIDHYYAEHSRYPGYNPSNSAPNGTWFVNQLTKYSDEAGEVSDTPTSDYLFGPYLQRPFPTNPLNGLDTVAVKQKRSDSVALGASGWIACLEDGSFDINTDPAELVEPDFTPAEKTSVEKALGL